MAQRIRRTRAVVQAVRLRVRSSMGLVAKVARMVRETTAGGMEVMDMVTGTRMVMAWTMRLVRMITRMTIRMERKEEIRVQTRARRTTISKVPPQKTY